MSKNFAHIDNGIRYVVEILNQHGFETWESCEGGDGHCFNLPTVRFWGSEFDLIRAFEVCENYNINPYQANRVYRKVEIATGDTEQCPKGDVWDVPFNELVFLKKVPYQRRLQ